MMMLLTLLACDEAAPVWQDRDGDGYALTDCDDDDPGIHPGAPEVCDGLDNDCSGQIDGADAFGSYEVYPDADGDGYGDGEALLHACALPDGFVTAVGDCDDADPAVHRAAAEVCDGHDNDCDGLVDDDDGDVSGGTWYYDADEDGYAGSSQLPRCAPGSPWRWVEALPDDCDDLRDAVYPGAEELCDDLDNDCDGLTDNDDSDVTDVILYPDLDGDGFGDPDKPSGSCPRPADAVADGTDCDDDDSSTWPGADERCDLIDNDCDGSIDEDVDDPPTMYADADGDGYGDPSDADLGCGLPGRVYNDSDCDDTDAAVSPELLWYADADGDGFGDPLSTRQQCTPPGGYTDLEDAEDCDDADADTFPGAPRGCDLTDRDCDGTPDGDLDGDGLIDSDSDGDGYPDDDTCPTSDCDDADDAVYPGAAEVCGDGVRNDCDEQTGTDDCFGAGLLSDHVTLTGDSSYDYAGRAVGGAGDVNGDGYLDLLVGAYGDSEVDNLTGAVHLVLGPVSADLDLSSADAKLHGASRHDHAGFALDGAGDVNDDGYDDILVGAYGSDDSGSSSGAAYVVLGPVTGDLDLASADASLVGPGASAEAGRAVSGAGDVDGDGYDDVLVGAPGAGSGDGAAYLLLGPLSGATAAADAIALSGGSSESLGSAMDTGDLDGDGIADLILGAPTYSSSRGRAYIFAGPVTASADTASAAAAVTGRNSNDVSGAALAAAGDVNDDGYEDLLVGAYGDDDGGHSSGSAFLLLGPVTADLTLSSADATLIGDSEQDSVGSSLDGAGDINGDGYDDLIIGGYGDEDGGTSSGTAYVVLGPITGTHILSEQGFVLLGDGGDHAGRAVAGVGDIDGNGLDDVLVGAPDAGLTESGAAYLVLMSGL